MPREREILMEPIFSEILIILPLERSYWTAWSERRADSVLINALKDGLKRKMSV